MDPSPRPRPDPAPGGRARAWPRRAAGLAAAALLAAAAAAAFRAVAPPVTLARPAEGERTGVGGMQVIVRFEPGSVVPSTFRALLNGADVTDAFVAADNGATARLHGLLDGENTLRVEVFGAPSPLWRHFLPEGTYRQLSREVRTLHRGPLLLDRG